MNDRLYVDFHILQTVPPSCVNRDDTGSPKTAFYGGTQRARVSSQAWKRAMRVYFKDIFEEEELGKRTKKFVEMVAQIITQKDGTATEEKAAELAKAAMDKALKKDKKGGDSDNKKDALLFLNDTQANAIADLALAENAGEKVDAKAYKAAIKELPSVDMVLFGRMVASDPSLNYDAAAQVAHSISTHTAQTEFDYFTAVDDLAPEDNAGAGHLGTVEYNSSTLYRYAAVNVRELAKQLGKDSAIEAVRGFAEAMICSMPTGRQNTFANRTLPYAVYVTVRRDQPVNLCGAFEKAVPASAQGFEQASADKLCAYAQEMYRTFAAEPAAAFVIGKPVEALGQSGSLSELLDRLAQTLAADGGQA